MIINYVRHHIAAMSIMYGKCVDFTAYNDKSPSRVGTMRGAGFLDWLVPKPPVAFLIDRARERHGKPAHDPRREIFKGVSAISAKVSPQAGAIMMTISGKI